MRENIGLFRGKRKDSGEWITGQLLKVTLNDITAYLIFEDKFTFTLGAINALSHAAVEPETVGECTGLRDKNGKLIFEGDILDGGDFNGEDGYGEVCWYDGAWEVSSEEVCGTFHENYNSREFEIIGNVYDDYELLEVGGI